MRTRYYLLDGLRGLAMISMILYHGTWNLVYLCGVDLEWYRLGCEGKMGVSYLWQQSICWGFILISGFCWSMGTKKWKRGLMAFGGGLLVTLVTVLVMPQNRIVFGVLTLLGSCMLLMIPMEKLVQKLPPVTGLWLSILCFAVTRNVNDGYLGFEKWNWIKLPDAFYSNWVTTYLGFPSRGFFSTDYFSLIPWIFLFLTGYFLYGLCQKKGWMTCEVWKIKIPCLSVLGKYSLVIYLLHQPILYGICRFIFG